MKKIALILPVMIISVLAGSWWLLLRGKFKFPKKLPRFFTLMFVPHSQQSIYRFKMPILLVVFVLILFVGSIFSIGYFTLSYLNMKENMTELKTLRSVNVEQKEKLKKLEEKTSELEQEISEVERLKNDVRIMLQSEELASRSGGGYARGDKLSSLFGSFSDNLLAEVNHKTGSSASLEEDSLENDSIKNEINNWDDKYSEIDRSTDSLAKEINNKEEELNELKKDVANEKEYLAAKPSGLPVAGRISSGYGNRRSPVTNRIEFHPAIDIAASYGKPINATGKGRVVFAGYKSGYGITVIIQHKFGFRTVYSHNSRVNVSVGETVSRGDCIAFVGSTGTSTGPHLHYEVILNGQNKDPADYLY